MCLEDAQSAPQGTLSKRLLDDIVTLQFEISIAMCAARPSNCDLDELIMCWHHTVRHTSSEQVIALLQVP